MKTRTVKPLHLVVGALLVVGVMYLGKDVIFSSGNLPDVPPPAPAAPQPKRPKYIRGIHLTAWVAGSRKLRANYDALFNETELNTVVIAVKEEEGEIYIPGVPQAEQLKNYTPAMPDIKEWLADLKRRGVYTIARVVVFKDNNVPRKKPAWAVKNSAGEVWQDRRTLTWVDPYNREVWDYNISIAERAVDLGFDEIQFDYIRFPSDGNTRDCRYSVKHSSTSTNEALVGFLHEARRRLKAKGALTSIDVFGLTTTVTHDMGIGQRIVDLTNEVDYVSPMVYPSHYNKGEYRIPDPNQAPYRTVFMSMSGAKKRLGGQGKLRPYLQDFSLGYKYGPKEVRAQIQACYDNDIAEWLLWNPGCRYTRSALKSKEFSETYEKQTPPDFTKEAASPGKPVTASCASSIKIDTAAVTASAVESPGTVSASSTTPVQLEKK